jgi:hypothetical protein
MSLIKLGEYAEVGAVNIKTATQLSEDPKILNKFKKFAQALKREFPKANDFLYFTAVMMHAAEAALVDDDGNVKLGYNGKPLEATWEKTANGGVKWVCSDNSVQPVRNANRDIFPESELKIAYPKWVNKPLCLDHKSSSVDFVRGLIVDTIYDDKRKRVIALCALDKVTYPDLAHKVSSGYTTSVSMGTAVGRAVCTDCGQSAKTEAEYCSHMSNKACYGEINLDLSPIELSIVVNGADPKAKIKHVIAHDLSKAAQHMSDYVEGKLAIGNVSKSDLDEIKEELAALVTKVEKLSDANFDDEDDDDDEDENDIMGPTGSTSHDIEPETSEQSVATLPEPNATWASVLNNLQATVNKVARDVENLSLRDNSMKNKRAYYQGTEEPTPGRKQYPVDPLNEEARNKLDKQMVGQSPFPDVGPVDGMHPGYASFGESEEARKRRLNRLASIEERKTKRAAILDSVRKQAYPQGTEEPTKYPIDPLNEEARNKTDKQMVGKAPFPGVGAIDRLYPGDEECKKLLNRAALSAKFVKAADANGNLDKGASRWDVYADGNMVALSLSVDEISKGRSEALFDSVYTKKFAQGLLKQIKAEGLDRVRSIFKGAQEVAKAVPGQPAAQTGPAMAPMDPAAMDMSAGIPEGMPGEMSEMAGEPSSKAEILAALQDAADDVARFTAQLTEAEGALNDEAEVLEDVPAASAEAFDENKPATLASLNKMRKTLNGMLRSDIRQVLACSRSSKDELNSAIQIYRGKYASFGSSNRQYIDRLANESLVSARQNVVEATNSLQAFFKYAEGTSNIKKRARAERLLRKSAQSEGGSLPLNRPAADTMDVKPWEIQRGSQPRPNPKAKPLKPNATFDISRNADDFDFNNANSSYKDSDGAIVFRDGDKVKGKDRSGKTPKQRAAELGRERGSMLGGKDNAMDAWNKSLIEAEKRLDADKKKQDASGRTDFHQADTKMVELPAGAVVPPGAKELVTQAGFNMKTKRGRTEYVKKLAQKGLQFSKLLNDAHPKGSHVMTGLSSKPEGDNAKIETLEDAHKKIYDVATAPVKVRKMAETIAKYVKAGEIAHEDVDQLVSLNIDPAAIKYYKDMWAQAKDSDATAFANKLTQNVGKEKKAEREASFQIQYKRAYKLAMEMKEKGLIVASDVDRQTDAIMKFNDTALANTQAMVNKVASPQGGMQVPAVGYMDSNILPVFEKKASTADTQVALDSIFSGGNSLRYSR